MKNTKLFNFTSKLSRDEMKKITGGTEDESLEGNPTCGIACSGGCRPSSDGCSKCGTNDLCQS